MEQSRFSNEEQAILRNARQKAKEWVESPGFKKDFEESMKQVDEVCDRIKRRQQIDWKALQEPFTV